MTAPTLHTPRLTLRALVMADLDALCDVFQSDRAQRMGGRLDRVTAWCRPASDIGMRDLLARTQAPCKALARRVHAASEGRCNGLPRALGGRS